MSRFGRISESERLTARARGGIPSGKKVLVSVGNCSPVKNHEVIVSAVAALGKRWDLLYLHVGVEDTSLSERSSAQELKISDRIQFLGWVRNVREIMVAADVFLMPSKFEGLGNAALEALAIGLPVLLADVPGLRDLRTVFPSIRYCEPTADSLAKELDEMLSAANLLTPMQIDEQVSTCRKIYDPARGAQQYALIYRELFGARLR